MIGLIGSVCLLFCVIAKVECARILIINPTPSFSHQIVIRPIVKALAERGHDIVFITPRPMKNERLRNLREIDVGEFNQLWIDESARKSETLFKMIFKLTETLLMTTKEQMKHPDVQNLIKNETEHFDLCIIEYYIPAWYAFKSRFGCAFISFVSVEAINRHNQLLGNAYHPVLYPDSCLGKPENEDFLSRLANFILGQVMNAYIDYSLNVECDKVVEEHFGKGYPKVGQLAEEVDMLFSNTNKVIGTLRPFSPSTISIGGGIQIGPEKNLPTHLQQYMDKSKSGVILISFGSNVNSAHFSGRVLKKMFNVFGNLSYDILWKFDPVNTTHVPKNVKLIKWLPQQDILRHKNVKLFITHAGLQSSEEGLLNQVPMLAVPIFGDQPYNAFQIEKKGIGIVIENLETVTSGQLKSYILDLTNNHKYKENLKILSAIASDEPMTPLDRAVWWTEYVLRHGGAKHLRGPIIPFYQHYLLDIFAFFFILTIVLFFIMYKIVKLVLLIFWKLFVENVKLKQQ